MISLNANPSKALKEYLVSKGITVEIYTNGQLPGSKVPDEFIEINSNGPITSIASQLGCATCNLLLSINVKLLSTGATNHVREDLILGSFQSMFQGAFVKSGFSFTIDKGRMVYQGKSIVSGYSTKILNIIVNF